MKALSLANLHRLIELLMNAPVTQVTRTEKPMDMDNYVLTTKDDHELYVRATSHEAAMKWVQDVTGCKIVHWAFCDNVPEGCKLYSTHNYAAN